MEVTLTYTDNNGLEQTQSIKPTNRLADQYAITAGLKADAITTGYQAVLDAQGGKGRAAMTAMQEFCDKIAQFDDLLNNADEQN